MYFQFFFSFKGKGLYNTLDNESQALFQVLKDYNNDDVIKIAADSHRHELRIAALNKGILLPNVAEASEKVIINLVFRPAITTIVRENVVKALNDIKFTRLNVNVIGKDDPIGNSLIKI